ncbi:hypothetical protein MKW92_025426, partial [Papaver armeniacum]
EQGKVKALEEQVVQLKQNEALLDTKISDAATELTRQLDVAHKKHEKEITDKVKEGVKEFINMRKSKLYAKSTDTGSANPEA